MTEKIPMVNRFIEDINSKKDKIRVGVIGNVYEVENKNFAFPLYKGHIYWSIYVNIGKDKPKFEYRGLEE